MCVAQHKLGTCWFCLAIPKRNQIKYSPLCRWQALVRCYLRPPFSAAFRFDQWQPQFRLGHRGRGLGRPPGRGGRPDSVLAARGRYIPEFGTPCRYTVGPEMQQEKGKLTWLRLHNRLKCRIIWTNFSCIRFNVQKLDCLDLVFCHCRKGKRPLNFQLLTFQEESKLGKQRACYLTGSPKGPLNSCFLRNLSKLLSFAKRLPSFFSL